MSVLSITAPQFTAEVERLEQETLTEEELTSANDVIYGTGSFNETDSMRCRGPAEMYMTLKDFPDEEKEAYLEALARAPQLVQTESDPLLFLRSENYNSWVSLRSVPKF